MRLGFDSCMEIVRGENPIFQLKFDFILNQLDFSDDENYLENIANRGAAMTYLNELFVPSYVNEIGQIIQKSQRYYPQLISSICIDDMAKDVIRFYESFKSKSIDTFSFRLNSEVYSLWTYEGSLFVKDIQEQYKNSTISIEDDELVISRGRVIDIDMESYVKRHENLQAMEAFYALSDHLD